jgi:hypothetical protein
MDTLVVLGRALREEPESLCEPGCHHAALAPLSPLSLVAKVAARKRAALKQMLVTTELLFRTFSVPPKAKGLATPPSP